jgi:predicted PurR-regulated permease PerM
MGLPSQHDFGGAGLVSYTRCMNTLSSTNLTAKNDGDASAEVILGKDAKACKLYLRCLVVLAIFYTLYLGRAVVLPIVLALLFTLILSPAIGLLKRMRIPEPVGAAIVVAALVYLIGFGAYSLVDPASAWIEKLPTTTQQIEGKLRGVKRSVQAVSKAADKVDEITSVEAKAPGRAQVVAPKPSLISRVLTGTQSLLVAAASTIVLLYFLLGAGDMFLRKLVRVLPRLHDKKHAVEIARTIQSEMARYLFTITCINCSLGVATALAMFWLGMPNPVLWGVMVALFNYVPYVGAAASLTILTAAAFVTFDEISKIAMVPAVFFAITVIEGQILAPIVTGRSLTLNPVVIFISMLVWAGIWGVVGALMAVPILMTFKVCCDHVDSLSGIGEFLSGKAAIEPEVRADIRKPVVERESIEA